MDRHAWPGGQQDFDRGMHSISRQMESHRKSLADGDGWDGVQGTIDTADDSNGSNGSYLNQSMESNNDNGYPVDHIKRLAPDDVESPLNWDAERVGQWLKDLDLPSQAFIDAGVTGQDIFALSKGEKSISGTQAMNKLRPFLARRVVYEADRLMGMIFDRSMDSSARAEPNAPAEGRSRLDSSSPLNGYVKSGSSIMPEVIPPPSPHQIHITPIKRQGNSKTPDVGIFEPPIFEPPIFEPPQPIEPSNYIHQFDNDDDNNSVDTIDSEGADEVREIADHKEGSHEDEGQSSESSVQSVASPSGSLERGFYSPAYSESKQETADRTDWLNVPAKAEAKSSQDQPFRQFGSLSYKSDRSNSSNSSNGMMNSMATLVPTPKRVSAPASAVSFQHEHHPISATDHHKHHKHKKKHNQNVERFVSFAPAERRNIVLDSSAQDSLATIGSTSSVGSPPSAFLEEDVSPEPEILPPRKLSLYKMTELRDTSFPSRSPKEKKQSLRVSFGVGDQEHELGIGSSIDTMDSMASISSPPAASIDSGNDEEKEQTDNESKYTPRERKLSLYKMTELLSKSFPSKEEDDHHSPRSRSIVMKKVQSKKFDDESMISAEAKGQPMSATASRNGMRKSNDSDSGLIATSAPPAEAKKKNRSLKFTTEENKVQVEKERKMKSGRKIRTKSPPSQDSQPSQTPSQTNQATESKKKNRGIGRIVLAVEEDAGNDSQGDAVGIGGNSHTHSDRKLKSLGHNYEHLLQTPKKKETVNGDFTEDGKFTFGEWTIDQDGIQSMPADRTDLSTAKAEHGRTHSGRSTPYSSRGHMGSRGGYTPSPPGYDLFHPSSDLHDSLQSLQQQQHGHYVAQASRKPGLSSILNDGMNPLHNPLDSRSQPLNTIQLTNVRSQHSHQPQPPSEERHHHKHKHKHKHHHKHSRQSRESNESAGDSDFNDVSFGSGVRESNGTWKSNEKLHHTGYSQDSLLSEDDLVNQGSLNSLNSRSGASLGGKLADTWRSQNSAIGESYDEVMLSSLKFDKSSMPIGGKGGDFEAEHNGFISRQDEHGRDVSTPLGFRPMSGNLVGYRPKSSQDRATTPNTPRKTKMNLVKLEELGRGAGGVVYKAVHVPTMTIVAVKHIFVEDDAKRRQMQRELNLLHAFNSKPLQKVYDLGDVAHLGRSHPINLLKDRPDNQEEEEATQQEGFGSHVVSIFDAYSDKTDRSVCLVLEYMSGGSLESFVKEHRRLSEAQIAHIARSCFLALSDLRKRRLLHRDIKPANILIDHLGNVKLSDFGIMKEFEEDSLSKTFTGTLAYMSPERILCGSGQSDEGYSYPADIWGVGLSLLALGLGKEPFPLVRTIWDVLSCQDESTVPSLRNRDNFANLNKIDSSNPNDYLYSADLCDMVDCCLRRDPKLRLTADELLKHPFFDRYPPCLNTAGLIASEKTVRTYGSKLREQEEKGDADPFEPPPPPLFGMFVTPEAAATRMLVALIKTMNPTTSSGLNSGNNTARGGMASGHDRQKKFKGLTTEILKRLRSQLPGIDESRFQYLHDRALKGLEGDERRKGLMSWVNQKQRKN